MVGNLTTGKWKASGISILWDGKKLSELASVKNIISMRSFFQISEKEWPEDLPCNNGDTLVVAGLDICLDILSPENSIEWMEQTLYPILRSFQMEYENQASLIFWLPSGKKRIVENASESSYQWLHWHNKTKVPISRCLWNGAEKDAKKIVYETDDKKSEKEWAGIYHPRIS